MPSVYDSENFQGRVDLAANYISAGRKTSRTFDTCFEMNDGKAVSLALFCRAKSRPTSRLARRIWDYLRRPLVEREAAEHQEIVDLPVRQRNIALKELSARLRARCS